MRVMKKTERALKIRLATPNYIEKINIEKITDPSIKKISCNRLKQKQETHENLNVEQTQENIKRDI